MPAIFISHSGKDSVTDRIKSVLAELGFEQVFLDFDKDSGIGAGEDWEWRLHQELSRCHVIMLMLTPSWLNSKWCFAELTVARALGKTIIPVICASLGDRYVLPGIQAIDLIDWNADGLERIEQRLRAITTEVARGFALNPHRPPYPGILAFEAEDAAIYFGRDDDIRTVIERLDARRTQGGARVLVILGASGAGKSSLLKAGILPQLVRRRTEWIVLPKMRPEKAPLEGLAKVVAELRAEPDNWRDWHRRLQGHEAIEHFGEIIKDLRVGRSRTATVLLPIDQLEELFTIAEPEERVPFSRLIAALFSPGRDIPIIAVATGRADVLQGMLETGELAPLTETILLLPMSLDRVPRVIEGPASVASLAVETGLAERMMQDVLGSEALPLLAYTLRLLYGRCVHEKRLTLAAYNLLGDASRNLNPIENSVRLAADAAIAGVKPSEAELIALRDAFVPHLVRQRLDDGKRVRQPARLSSLPKDARRLIHTLTEARLLTVHAVDGEAIIEVAHEALFAAWPVLATWLDDERAFLADVERIRTAFDAWSDASSNQKPQALLQGLLLASARIWLIKFPQRFSSQEMATLRGFIEASATAEDAATAGSQRLRRRVFQASVVAALIFLTASVVTGWQWRTTVKSRDEASQQRNIAIANDTARLAVSLGDTDFEQSLLLAATAFDIDASFLTKKALFRTLASNTHITKYLRGHLETRQNAGGTHFRPDGVSTNRDQTIVAAVATVAGRGYLNVWDLRTNTSVQWEDSDWSIALALSPDGLTLVTATVTGRITTWNAGTGQKILSWQFGTGAADSAPVVRIVFSRDGSYFATDGYSEGQISFWETSSGKLRSPPISHKKGANRLSLLDFSTAGESIIVLESQEAANGANRPRRLDRLDVNTRQLTQLIELDNTVGALAVSPNGRYLAYDVVKTLDHAGGTTTIESTGDIVVLDLETLGPVCPPLHYSGNDNNSLGLDEIVFSNDNSRIATIGWDDVGISMWTLPDGAEVYHGVRDRKKDRNFEPEAARFVKTRNADGLVTLDTDGAVILWEAGNERSLALNVNQMGNGAAGSLDSVLALSLASTEQPVVVGLENGRLALHSGQHSVDLSALNPQKQTEWHWGNDFVFKLSRSGKYLIMADTNSHIILYELASNVARDITLKQFGKIVSVAIAQDDDAIAIGNDKGAFQIFSISGRFRAQFALPTGMERVTAMEFSTDSKLLSIGDAHGNVIIWDMVTGGSASSRIPTSPDGVSDLTFDPASRYLGVSGNERFSLWTVPRGSRVKMVGPISGLGESFLLRFSKDPDLLFAAYMNSGTGDGNWRNFMIMDQSGRETMDLALPVPAGPFKPSQIEAMELSLDSKQLAVVYSLVDNAYKQVSEILVFWDVDPGSWKQRVCEIVNRNMLREEWRRYFGDQPYRAVCIGFPIPLN